MRKELSADEVQRGASTGSGPERVPGRNRRARTDPGERGGKCTRTAGCISVVRQGIQGEGRLLPRRPVPLSLRLFQPHTFLPGKKKRKWNGRLVSVSAEVTNNLMGD